MARAETSILLVDDVPDNLQVLSLILIGAGYRARPVTSGDAALKTIAAERPDLILADIKMPGMDGYELCRRLKADPATREIPVIFISALGETRDKVQAFEVGGVDYITKPFQGGEVLARVRTHLAVHQLNQSLQDANRTLEDRVQQRTMELTQNLAALQTTRATLNLVLDTVPHAIFWKDAEGRYLGCNRVFAEVAGLGEPALVVGRSDFDLAWPAEHSQAYWRDDQEVIRTNRPKLHIIEPLQRPDGRRLWLSTCKAPLSHGDGIPFAVLGVFEDITDRIRAERAKEALLHISEASHAASSVKDLCSLIHRIVSDLFPATNFYIAVLDPASGDLSFPYFVDETDAPPPPRKPGHTLADLVLISGRPYLLSRAEIETMIQAGTIQVQGTLAESWLGAPLADPQHTFGAAVLQSYTKDFCYSQPDIAIFQFVAAQIAACVLRKQAEQDTRKLQSQLQQSQKMESLGSLAGGVAHDMNNVLAAILALASAHLQIQPAGSRTHQAFETIAEAASRGGKMVKSLLSFARQSPAEQKLLDLNAILLEQVQLLERTVLADVHLELDLAADTRPIRGDANVLAHAFMNLCVNAVDAMGQAGKLSFRTRNLDRREVEVQISDTGCGMTQEVLDKALDPFFTTKEVGKGTGLGLALVYSAMKAHRGRIEIHSEPGQGTQVVLSFPTADGQDRDAPTASAPAPAPQQAFRLLLVDDDDLVLQSTRLLLEVMGHQVTAVSRGEDALALIHQGLAPQGVILDMNMPGLGGQGTLAQLRGLRPELPVFLATGRTDQAALDLVKAYPGVSLLAKPFNLEELREQLRSLAG